MRLYHDIIQYYTCDKYLAYDYRVHSNIDTKSSYTKNVSRNLSTVTFFLVYDSLASREMKFNIYIYMLLMVEEHGFDSGYLYILWYLY